MSDHRYEASRAVTPYFYRAPFPETSNGDVPSEYQHAAAEYILAREHGLIGDAPGVGKTLEAVLVSNALEAKRTLVVCPASLRLNWEKEIWKWSTIPDVSTYPILKGSDGVSFKHDYVITSYDLLRNTGIQAGIMDQMWDHVILDEAHALKDPKGNQRTKVICAPDMLPSVTGRFTMLSGTIMPNQPIEVYNAARLLDFDSIDGMSLNSFRQYYYEEGEGFIRNTKYNAKTKLFESKTVWSDRVRNVPRNMKDLNRRMRGNFMVRRLKEQVLHELPEQNWHLFPMDTSVGIRQALRHPGWAQAEQLYEMDPDAYVAATVIDGEVSTAHRELGEAKAPHVVAYIRELLASGVTKIVVGAWHHSVLDYMRAELQEYGLVYMDGRTSTGKKQAAVDDFQERDEVQIILGQIISLGEGWTLTAAQDCVIGELYWVGGKLQQFFDRISRRGQTGAYTTGHVPVIPDSLEERMFNRVITKEVVIHEALDGAG